VRVEAYLANVGSLLELGRPGLIKFPVPSPALISAASAGYERGFQTTPRHLSVTGISRAQHQINKIA
jgi:hypothetical protein